MTSIIDSHVHVWDPAVNEYDWLSGDLDRAYLPAEYRAKAPDSTGVVFVQAGAVDGLAEARWVDSLVWPQLLGIVAHAPLERGEFVADDLDELQGIDRVVGVRRLLQDEPLAFFADPALLAGLGVLADRGLPFDACVRHPQLAALTTLLAGVPGLPVVLDHLGKPPVATGDDGQWERDLRSLAALPQVRVKLSGIAPEASSSRPVREQARAWVLTAIDAFGTERCMVGSDWPVSAVSAAGVPPGRWLADVLEDSGANVTEREWLSWRTASEFYGLRSER